MKTKILLNGFLVLLLLVSLSISDGIASWDGPINVFSAQWGKADGQLGYESQDTADDFPRSILVTDDNRILIGDKVNDRIVIIDQRGRFYKSFRPSALPSDAHMASRLQWTALKGARFLLKLGGKYQVYNTQGILLNEFDGTPDYIQEIISLPDNSIIVHKYKPISYYHYKSDGTLLKVDTSEPQEIMKIREQRQKIIQTLNIPVSTDDVEIGPPVFAPNGAVYVWKTTTNEFSIIKWSVNDKH